MIIVTVKEPLLLAAMHAVVGGVEIQNQMLWWLTVRRDELVDQDAGDFD